MGTEVTDIEVTGERDLILTGENLWITVENLSVRVRKTDEGVIVDIYGAGHEDEEELASTYAFFTEVEDYEEEEPCFRVTDGKDWLCVNNHTGCVYNDGHGICTCAGTSDSPLEEIK